MQRDSAPLAGRLCFALTVVLGLCHSAGASELGFKLDDEGATVTIDGELFTKYLTLSGTKPILFPVIGPTGEPMTRGFPMQPRGPHEKDDHRHHRSIWFGYEGINGVNFWNEPADLDKPGKHDGRQVHKRFSTVELDGETVLLVTENDFVNAKNEVVAQDERSIRFGIDGETRWIDYAIKLWSPKGPLKLNDTKEGAFAVRVAGSMKVEGTPGGTFVNSQGEQDGAAWGKSAKWVDYSGPVNGETVGIAILAHPDSLQAEPRWHVREYGLFAANPVGASEYSGGQEKGGLERPEGEPIVLRHRILLHRGDHRAAGIAEAHEEYARSE